MPWGVAAAVTVGAISARQAGKSAEQAADVQAQAAREGVAESARQFDQTREDFQPFREAGVGALGQQQALLGLSGQEAQEQAFAGLKESPAQQFLRSRAERGLIRNQAAIGGLGGGNIRTALQEQGTAFAQQDISNQFNRLATLTGGGQAATTNVAKLGAAATAQQNASNMQAANAQASGILGAQQAQGQFLGQLGRGFAGGAVGQNTSGVGFGRGFGAGLIS